MQLDTQISFTLLEWLSLTGLTQCVWILVYAILRVENWKKTILVLGYFFVLGASFFAQFSFKLGDFHYQIKLIQWFLWMATPPLSYLLIIQVAQNEVPSKKEFLVLLLIPMALFAGWSLKDLGSDSCQMGAGDMCTSTFHWLYWVSSIVGIFATLFIWSHKNIFGELWEDKGSRDKYWLVMVLIIANIGIISINLLRSTDGINPTDADSVLLIMGILFAYLATTTMFRVYPPPVTLNELPSIVRHNKNLTEEEKRIAQKIEKLMEEDKLYHEISFDRAALARELKIAEGKVSRIINIHYQKSFPRLLSEHRVEDAKRMLQTSEIAVNVIASEVGFNSIASFNRIFKDVEGVSPTEYRNAIV